VKRLLLEGANVRYRDVYELTPCAVASARGHTAIVKILLANGADINATGNSGWSYCHLAACRGRINTLRVLVSHKVPFDTLDDQGRTPHDLANQYGHHQVVAYLDALVRIRHITCFLIGIRRGTNRQGMGELLLLPKDIVLMIARRVWATRDDPEWLVVAENNQEK
jgi:ankyrin repeat protein